MQFAAQLRLHRSGQQWLVSPSCLKAQYSDTESSPEGSTGTDDEWSQDGTCLNRRVQLERVTLCAGLHVFLRPRLGRLAL